MSLNADNSRSGQKSIENINKQIVLKLPGTDSHMCI